MVDVICKDPSATLTASTERSTAFTNQFYSGLLSTNLLELNNEKKIVIYPNPTSSEFILESDKTLFSKQDEFQLYSTLGKQLYSKIVNSQQTRIDLSKYPQGTYILRTNINGVQKSFKILKQ